MQSNNKRINFDLSKYIVYFIFVLCLAVFGV